MPNCEKHANKRKLRRQESSPLLKYATCTEVPVSGCKFQVQKATCLAGAMLEKRDQNMPPDVRTNRPVKLKQTAKLP